LSISYDIVTQQHGGTIMVESEPRVHGIHCAVAAQQAVDDETDVAALFRQHFRRLGNPSLPLLVIPLGLSVLGVLKQNVSDWLRPGDGKPSD
jgi:hypothetical protein